MVKFLKRIFLKQEKNSEKLKNIFLRNKNIEKKIDKILKEINK